MNRRWMGGGLAALLSAQLCLFAGGAGDGDAPAHAKLWKAELMAADRAFVKETAERGLDGWMAYMAESAVILPGTQPVRGFTNVREYMLPALGSQNFSLTWEPTEPSARS